MWALPRPQSPGGPNSPSAITVVTCPPNLPRSVDALCPGLSLGARPEQGIRAAYTGQKPKQMVT
jgi:hypothetical protein